jgi:signal transduction histidine kinase
VIKDLDKGEMDARDGSGVRVHRHKKGLPSKSAGETRTLERLIADLCGAFVRATVDQIDDEISRWLKRIVLTLGLDRSTVAELDSLGGGTFSHGWARDPNQIIRQPLDVNVLLPWLVKKVMAGETVIISSLDDLPEEAAVDRESFRCHGTKSNVTIPIRVGGEVVGGVGFATMYRERKWTPNIVEQLQLVAEIFGYALERKKSVGEIRGLREELTHVSRVTTLGELAASIAHELNQPLAAIMNNAEAVQLLLASNRPNLEAVRTALSEIVSEDDRANKIIGRFRQLFKRRKLQKSTVSPNDLLEDVECILRDNATSKNVSLVSHVAPSLPWIAADRILIQQLIINLVLNAFDSVCGVAEGPREVEVSASPGNPGFLNFAVRDTGTGIQKHLMPHLFESFITTKPHGLGMGLAIARSIVEAHGGRLWARQNADRGATFEFTLPTESGP